jgi:hypothetical protein
MDLAEGFKKWPFKNQGKTALIIYYLFFIFIFPLLPSLPLPPCIKKKNIKIILQK